MDLYKIKKSFWKLRQNKRVTNLQADLYDYLLHESNTQGEGSEWENPFECSNKLINVNTGISEDAIIDARNRLKQLGLIDFTPGQRNRVSPVYELFYPFRAGNMTGKNPEKKEKSYPLGTGNLPNTEPNTTPNTEPNTVPNTEPNLYKEKPDNTITRQDQTTESCESGSADSPKKAGPKSPPPPTDPVEASRPEKEKSCAKKEKEAALLELASEVLLHLNQIADRQYGPTAPNLKFIIARIREGEPLERLKQVIEVMTYKWKDRPGMRQYLRPETLFNPTKYPNYANEVRDALKNPALYREQHSNSGQKAAAGSTISERARNLHERLQRAQGRQ